MQENDAFSEHPMPFVLYQPPKLSQCFTINLWHYCCPWCHEFCQQNSLTVPEYCSHHSFVQQCLFEFLGLVGRMHVHPLFRLLFGVCIHELYPSLVTSHNSVKKFIPLFPVVLQKRQGWPNSLSFVKVSQLFWYPPCTELMVTQSVRDNLIQSSPWSLWKLFRKFWYRETTFSTHALVDFLNKFISHNWVLYLTTLVMHVIAPIPEFSASFFHTTVTHNIITVYTT